MRVEAAFLANYAEVRGSLGYISGAFPEWWNVTELPSVHQLAAVLLISLDDHELGTKQTVDFGVMRPGADDVELLARAEFERLRDPDAPAGTSPTEKIVLNMHFEFQSLGVHRFMAKAGSDERAVLLPVRLLPSAG